MLDLQNPRVRLALFVAGLIALSMTAEKFRELVGESASSKSGKFTFLNCFDMGSGSLACSVKEGVKLYVYNIRNAHVENIRQRSTEAALVEALTGGLGASEAAKQAQKAGAKAAKLASRQAKRILGPIISSGWDFFEAIYYEGTMTEGFLRGTGTLFGTYAGGFLGDQRLGKFGYLIGSHLGSWVGGRIGLMVYDVVNGISYLLQFVQPEESTSTHTVSEDASFVDTDEVREKVEYKASGEDTIYYENVDESHKRENFDYGASGEDAIYPEIVDESRKRVKIEYEASSEDTIYSENVDEGHGRENVEYEASREDTISSETVDESQESSSGWGFF